MGPVLHADVDAVTRRESLLEPHAHRKSDDSRQRAMVDGRREVDHDCGKRRLSRRSEVDVWEPDDRELSQSVRMLRIRNGGD